MIRQLLRAVQWRALLVPAGAALLTAGINHLEQRRDSVQDQLVELDGLVAFRRAQLNGSRPLTDDPDDDDQPDLDLGQLAAAPLVLLGLGLGLVLGLGLGLAAAAAVRSASRLDEPVDELDDLPDPWQRSTPVDEPVDEPVGDEPPVTR
jgi:hypothetical protein